MFSMGHLLTMEGNFITEVHSQTERLIIREVNPLEIKGKIIYLYGGVAAVQTVSGVHYKPTNIRI